MDDVRVEAWRVHDTGLVAAPGRFRRLGGVVRHHQGQGEAWPAEVVLIAAEDQLQVTTRAGDEVGTWPIAEVTVTRAGDGPPVTFIVQLPDAAHLLAAAASPATATLLAALT